MRLLKLVDRYEEVAYGEITRVTKGWGLSVYPKVRVADIISLDGIGAKGDLKRFGLQAHFDFVICRNRWTPAYVIEFDGRYHAKPDQIARDSKKDALCKHAGLPILRINSNYLFPNFGSSSLLAWIIDVHELALGFQEQQECGSIPPDEVFDPFLILSTEPGGERFPYWFSAKSKIRLQALHRRNAILDPSSSGFIGYDDAGIMRGVEYIRLTSTSGVYVRTAMRPQQFPIVMGDLLDEILSVQLVDRVARCLNGWEEAVALDEIYKTVAEMQRSLSMARAHGYSGPKN